MKVLLVNKFHWRKGGSETYYFGLAEGLRKLGHEVAFFSMCDERNEACDQERFFVSASDYNGRTSPVEKLRQATSIAYSKEAKEKFELVLREERPDIIHLNLIHRQITFSILDAPSATGIPVVYTCHDYILLCPNYLMLDGNEQVCDECMGGSFMPCVRKRCVKGSRAKSMLAKYEADYLKSHKTYLRFDKIIAPSEFMREKLIEGGFPGSQVVALQNFAQEDVLKRARSATSAPREHAFLYFGRLSREKGVDIIVGAFLAVMDFLPKEWRLKIVGDGPERERIERLIDENHAEGRIELLGHLDMGDVLAHAERASLAIAGSRCRENMPYSIIEAFACGTPVIGARIGGIPELVVDGETGLLCEPDEIDSMADALLRGAGLFDDCKRYETMQRNCRKYVLSHCSQDEYMEKLIALYWRLIDEKKDGNAKD